ncbi:hypothetical protein [Psychrobacillus psychrodurans]|uniref:Uncharacterized protein n=1 Tax=Psychrobacillus psychrodurans TaxID=126157 RepID=A0A9X3LA12_9BACI|nr:hypothetical protein [Psychrobacillus psychrodurans]MCZ8533875.1 hypothetical protein [Psychrobacillus psychrodurans]
MAINSITGQKWWKIGTAAFLTVGLLAACGDDNNDDDNLDDNPVEEDVDVNIEDDENVEDNDVDDKE